jgi:hypothetical protein
VKWISHKLTTFANYYTISGAPIQSLLASTSSILPDAIEMGPGRVIFRKHRGTSHNPLFWFLTLPVLFYLLKKMLPEIALVLPGAYVPEPEAIFLAITIGIILHLAADSLSDSGIPLIGKKRFAPRVYRSFTLSEFAVVFFVLSSCGIWLALRRFRFS